LGGLEVTPPEIRGLIRARIFRGKQVEPEPAPVRPRNFLRLPEKSDEKKEHQISIDPGLEFEVAGEIFRGDLAFAPLELKGGVQRVVELLHEGDERPDVAIAQAGTGIVALELFDQPARIINSDVKLIVGATQESAGQLAELARIRARQAGKLGAP